MTRELSKVLILDDDPVLLKLLEVRIKSRFPDLTVDCRQRPVAVGLHDIYILDNDFEGRPLAADLAEEIKKHRPQSLVVALSGTLTTETLKRLINCGCDGAFDKSVPSEIDSLMSVMDQFLRNRPSDSLAHKAGSSKFVETTRAITRLIQDWNHRLELEERREQHTRENNPASALYGQEKRS